ncbi:MAG: protein FlbA [Rhodospirillaceae bacterium]|nr:MAG: protein FlbA [Rhodospirillaceae bacterium]
MQKTSQISSQDIEKLIANGLEYQNAGKIEIAKNYYLEALKSSPKEPNAIHFLGVAYHQLGDNEQAEKFLKEAVQLKPNDSQTQNHYGCALLALNKISGAELAFRKSIELNSSNADALFNLGQLISRDEVLAQSNNDEEREKIALEAVELLNKAVTLNPDQLEWKVKLAGALLQAGKKDLSSKVLDFILQQKSDHPEVYFFKSRLTAGRSAHQNLQKSLILKPDAKSALSNFGFWNLIAEKKFDALIWFQRAMVSEPGNVEVQWNHALGLLANGDLENGWAAAKCRHFKPEMYIERLGLPPEWDGKEINDGTLFVFQEQGIGDELRFANCFEDLSKNVKTQCFIETDARLIPLFSRSFPELSFIKKLERKVDGHVIVNYTDTVKKFSAAAHCPLGDLPLHFRQSIDHFNFNDAYLVPDDNERAHWRKIFQQIGAELKIGFCWQTALPSKTYDNYFPDLNELDPIFSLKNATFINLQYTDCEQQLQAAEKEFDISIFRPPDIDMFNELDRVSALISECDIVIGPMTAVISMAGAVGTRCYGLNLHPDWTCLGTDTQPWTPRMTCRYRGHSDSWKIVIEEIAEEIKQSI